MFAHLLILLLALCYPLPETPPEEYSRVLLDRKGELLRVWLNTGMQFRFPASGTYDSKYRICVREFEDRRFEWHPGVDPFALVRAMRQNSSAGHIQSGASTLPMQIARMRSPSERTYGAKVAEIWSALRMNFQWSKDSVFHEYASLAPMGGNMVGADAACWRYFGHAPDQMTWAEAALLAVLPNQPSALNLKKERPKLMQKRNRLLDRLYAIGKIDTLSLQQSKQEPIPTGKEVFRFYAPHYAEHLALQAPSGVVQGTLDLETQLLAERRAEEQLRRLEYMGVRNVAVLILSTQTSEVLGYVGSQDWQDTVGIGRNNGVTAYRSTGSLLKPFLYGLALQRGPWTTQSMLEDVPTWYGAFSPVNADQQYSGLVTLQDALARSLNVPAVRMLSEYGLVDFYSWLKQSGLKGLFRLPEQYGLPLVIGGAESNLYELVPLYAMLMNAGVWHEPQLWNAQSVDSLQVLHPGAAWLTTQMLTTVRRPDIDEYHQWLDNQVPVAWKTGTSFGARDAWAIGTNAQWTIGVWVGNFAGGGIEGLTGAKSAAPLMIALMNDLTERQKRTWPDPPNHRLRGVEVCSFSGDLAHDGCPHKVTLQIPDGPRGARSCPLHRTVVANRARTHTVCSRCWFLSDTVWMTETVIPPQAKEFLATGGMDGGVVLPHNPMCQAPHLQERFRLVYPGNGSRILIPRGFDGKSQKMVAEASHENPQTTLFWYLDGVPIGKTSQFHRIALDLGVGKHEVVLQDASGATRKAVFEVSRK